MTTTMVAEPDFSDLMHKAMHQILEYRGIYGDDPRPEKIHATHNPDHLGAGLKKTLMGLKEDPENHIETPDFEKLASFGLVRRIGNDWNKGVVFHPAAELWLERHATRN